MDSHSLSASGVKRSRMVRTSAGAKRYGQPIGSVILPNGKVIPPTGEEKSDDEDKRASQESSSRVKARLKSEVTKASSTDPVAYRTWNNKKLHTAYKAAVARRDSLQDGPEKAQAADEAKKYAKELHKRDVNPVNPSGPKPSETQETRSSDLKERARALSTSPAAKAKSSRVKELESKLTDPAYAKDWDSASAKSPSIKQLRKHMLPQAVEIASKDDYNEMSDTKNVRRYSSLFYQDVRSFIDGTTEEDDYYNRTQVEPIISTLDRVTDMKLPSGVKMYRGMRFENEDDFDLTPGTEFTDPSFTSMTLDAEVTKEFTENHPLSHESSSFVLLEMTTKDTDRGAPIDLFTRPMGSDRWIDEMTLDGEQEVLLPRAQTYRVISSKVVGGVRTAVIETVRKSADQS